MAALRLPMGRPDHAATLLDEVYQDGILRLLAVARPAVLLLADEELGCEHVRGAGLASALDALVRRRDPRHALGGARPGTAQS